LSEQTNPTSVEAKFAALVTQWALAGNTSDVIEWEKLPAKVRDAPEPISEGERCRLMLRVANAGALTAHEWNQLVGVRILRTRSASGAEPDDARSLPMPPDRLAWLRRWLGVIVSGKPTERAELMEITAKEASERVLIFPTWKPGRERADRVIARNVPSALCYGIWLLADTTRHYSRDLCRCNYSACGEFFMKRTSGPGAPVRRFCSEAHAEAGDREAAQRRMAKIRRKHK